MKNWKKSALLCLCAIALMAATVLGTMAWLTDQASVVNTMTVGKVDITVDEAKVNPDGTPVAGANRVKENKYHLIPGQTYTKDPTMTVMKDSEKAYVRILVTVNCYDKLTAIFGDSFLPQYFVSGWDNAVWVSTQEISEDAENNTATYEFRYKESVKPDGTSDVVLPALFTSFTIPGTLDGEDLESINNLKITVTGHAIQATGFDDDDAAWAAFDAQVAPANP